MDTFVQSARALEIRSLIDMMWPGLAGKIAIADSLGIYWESISHAFTHYVGEKLVAHVGTFQMPVLLNNQVHQLGFVHAVCTHPDYRRKGYSTVILNEALDYLDQEQRIALVEVCSLLF